MSWIKENEEVFYPEDSHQVTILSKQDTDFLQNVALSNERKRSRICTHSSIKDDIHEMFIYHPKATYVRPHKHMSKDESFCLIVGEIDLVIFNDDGMIVKVLRMGNYESGKAFYYRIHTNIYHTQIFREDTIFHEVSKGPFNKKNNLDADWAPNEKNGEFVKNYINKLEIQINEKVK